MVLLWGISEDGPIRAVKNTLEQWRAPHLLLDQFEVWRSTCSYDVHTIAGFIEYDGATIDLDDVHSFYLRPYETQRIARTEGRTDPESIGHAERFSDALLLWSEITDARVVNRPSRMSSNSSKPYQASLIRQAGFDTPATLITSDIEQACEFQQTYGQVIYKSMSGVRSKVSPASNGLWERLKNAACPIQLQEYIPGLDYRVHVIGDEVFACRIDSLATDYRYPGCTEEPDVQSASIPAEIAAKCVELARTLDFVLTGIDLRHAQDGRWICFEANPSPGYTYYEEASGQPLTEAVATLLIR